LYLDGVYVGRSVGAIFDLADIERVEVLRGPQGTLFGRNATGGAISLITAAPTGEFGIKQDVSIGNNEAFRSRTVLNLPAFGSLALKLSYLHDENDGVADNLVGGARSISGCAIRAWACCAMPTASAPRRWTPSSSPHEGRSQMRSPSTTASITPTARRWPCRRNCSGSWATRRRSWAGSSLSSRSSAASRT